MTFRAVATLVRVGALVVALTATANAEPSPHTPRASKQKAASKAAVAKLEPVLEPKAIDLLKAMGARLAAARTMSFTAVSTYESPSRIGPALAYTTLSEVTLQRPDRLRVITPGDGPASEFYYDGHTMMAYAPAENLVAVADAPPTIDAALKAAYDGAAIYFPFTDVVVADPYKDIADGLLRAFFIGQSHVVGGTTTNMVAIANDTVFAQIWIGADDQLPRMIRAVFAADPLRLRNQVELSNWRLDGDTPAELFASAKAAAAQRIQFARPDPVPPPGVGPPKKGHSTKPGKPPSMK
jgi:hypothetical protein